VRFFLDNCLSIKYARALQALSEIDGHEVIHLSDRFSRDAPDAAWIRGLGEEGEWVIVSGDTRIHRTEELMRVWTRSGLTAFFLAPGWMRVRYWDQATMLVRWWPHILEQARLVEWGSGFEVPHRSPTQGRFKVIGRRY